jgi:hypothetical protein
VRSTVPCAGLFQSIILSVAGLQTTELERLINN